MSGMPDSVAIIDPASPPPGGLPTAFDGDLVVFPHSLDGDRGVYNEQLVPIVKGLRTDGVEVRWLHDSDHRLWSGERSALLALAVIPFVVGIASSAGWAGLARLLRRRSGQVKLTAGYRKDSFGGEEQWMTLEGNSADVAAALERFNPWQSGAAVDKGERARDE
jgi:hypothetical protein